MDRIALYLGVVLAFTVVCGCGDAASSGSDNSNDTGQDSGRDGFLPSSEAAPRLSGERAVPGSRPICPDGVEEGQACTEDGLWCSYGDSKTWRCRTVFSCVNATWKVIKPGCETPEQPCSPVPKHQSPCEPKASISDTIFTPKRCVTQDGYCECFICDRFLPEDSECLTEGTKWQCFSPPQNLDCPLLAPNYGEGCSTPGTYCFYGVNCNEAGMGALCRNGVWEYAGTSCEQ